MSVRAGYPYFILGFLDESQLVDERVVLFGQGATVAALDNYAFGIESHLGDRGMPPIFLRKKGRAFDLHEALPLPH